MSIKPVKISSKAMGTMSMTWTTNPPPLEESIKTLEYARTKYGVKVFNGSVFYQMTPEKLNLQLLRAFVLQANDPDLIISIKGGTDTETFTPKGDKATIDADIKLIDETFGDLNPKPKILYQISRVDKTVPFDQSIGFIYDHVKSGTIDGISISEVGAKSIAIAASVAPISTIEVEISLFAQDIIFNDVLTTAAKYNIPIVPYSPLCRGMLTDFAVENDFLDTIPEGDVRKLFKLEKFQPENYKKNFVCLKKLYDFAHGELKTSLECLALSYLYKLSNLKNFEGINNLPQFIPIPSGSTIDKLDKNFGSLVEISDTQLLKIQNILKENKVVGLRYNSHAESTLNG